MILRTSVLALLALAMIGPALGQIKVLDTAQDAAGAGDGAAGPAEPALDIAPPAPPPICGTQPLSIARMGWPSASLLAEIHARILTREFGCEVRISPGELAATISSMGSTGQPAVAPEFWANRVADLWNGAMDGQMVRSAAPTYVEAQFEGWFMPTYLEALFVAAPKAADLAAALPQVQPGVRTRFISCPIDWACSVINRNLVRAYGLAGLVDIVEPANRFEMDRLIAEAVNKKEFFLFYYWRPNAVLAQLDFATIDMGAYDEAAAKCLAERVCADPKPSAFASDLVVVALAERVFTDMPAIAGYFQRASLGLTEMDVMLAQLNAPGATPESVADRFVSERGDLWRAWTGAAP
ncbi:MAG: hypothetical protein ABS75_09985 [Pelagibacterium sp. SCN 63-23]|nr:MAG: hypothetical protein ABS75_09985 [Pelagibacterium sp. SCN 63-23]